MIPTTQVPKFETRMGDVATLLVEIERLMIASEIPEARREAYALVATALAKDRTFLYAHPEYQPTTEESQKIGEFVRRRASGEPLQYIRGSQEFYGLDFEVTPDVLIPRPETEILVEKAIAILNEVERPKFLDIGTGTGCIAISIIRSSPSAAGVAVDISPAALAVAKRNAEHLDVSDRLQLVHSDIFGGIAGEKFNLIVSNPPYVPNSDLRGLQPEVVEHEPHAALTDGGDGLSIIHRVISNAPDHLSPGGYLLIEIGFGQSERVREIASEGHWEEAHFLPDLQGIPRVFAAKLR